MSRLSYGARTAEETTQYYPRAIGMMPATTHYWDWGLGDTFTFSPTLVATFRASVVGSTYEGNGGAYILDPSLIKTPQQIATQMAFKGLPAFALGEGFGAISSTHAISTELVPSLSANFSKMHGNHNLRWGADYRMDRYNDLNPGPAGLGSFTFDPVFTRSDPFTNSTSTTSGTSLRPARSLRTPT